MDIFGAGSGWTKFTLDTKKTSGALINILPEGPFIVTDMNISESELMSIIATLNSSNIIFSYGSSPIEVELAFLIAVENPCIEGSTEDYMQKFIKMYEGYKLSKADNPAILYLPYSKVTLKGYAHNIKISYNSRNNKKYFPQARCTFICLGGFGANVR